EGVEDVAVAIHRVGAESDQPTLALPVLEMLDLFEEFPTEFRLEEVEDVHVGMNLPGCCTKCCRPPPADRLNQRGSQETVLQFVQLGMQSWVIGLDVPAELRVVHDRCPRSWVLISAGTGADK